MMALTSIVCEKRFSGVDDLFYRTRALQRSIDGCKANRIIYLEVEFMV